MKLQSSRYAITAATLISVATPSWAQESTNHLFMDVHDLDSVTAEAVADAHQKDLAVQGKHGVNFIRYWVDEENARVYCLSEAKDAKSISAAHAEAHGLIPQNVFEVTDGIESTGPGKGKLFLDIHRLGAGKVTAEDVAQAHEKDLAAEGRHGVSFINYWVDPRTGEVFCLSEAGSAEDVLATHREAHGLVSDQIAEVTQGE